MMPPPPMGNCPGAHVSDTWDAMAEYFQSPTVKPWANVPDTFDAILLKILAKKDF